jgi:type IV secretion system protein VirB10
MGGYVDNKYFEVFSSAFLTSALDIGTAAIGDALFGNQQTTTTTNGNGSSTTESPTAAAMQQAVQNIGNIGNSIVNSALNLAPTIYIDQGTQVNVFVNRDLIFPPEVTGSMGFVQ